MICRQLKYGGGMEKFFCMLVNYLVDQQGEEVVVIIEGSRFEDEYKLSDKISVIALNEIRNSHGVMDAIGHNLSIYAKLTSAIRQTKPNLIVSFLPELATICKIRFPHIKTIGSLRVNPKTDLHGVKDRWMAVQGSKKLDGFIFLTQGARKCFPEKTSRRATVIPLAVEEPSECVDYKSLPEKKMIYASGRFVAGKHFDDIIRAFYLVCREHADYRLTIFGDGEKKSELVNLANELGLSSSVDMPGMTHDLMSKMKDGYMYVFASDSEGYSNALSEAMMLGLPCVATDCEFGPGDMIQDGRNGRLVPVGDIKAMAKAMKELIENPQMAVSYSKKSVEFRKNHSIDRIMNAHYQYMRSVAGGAYSLPFSEKLWNKLSTTQYTIGWSAIERDDDTLLKKKKEKTFHFMPLNGKEWYADPILFEYDSVTYVFMELYDMKENKGCIAYSVLTDEGMSEPKRIIEEKWHMSFPYIFEMDDGLYMLPETNVINSLCFYKCKRFPDKWEMACKIQNERGVSDSIIVKTKNAYYAITPQKKEENGMYTRLVVGKLDVANKRFEINREEFCNYNSSSEYSLFTRNGGAPFYEGEKLIRVAQESTPVYYGVALRFFEIKKLERGAFEECEIARIDLDDISGDFPKRYRREGVHTYGRTDRHEVIDMMLKSLRP